MKKSTTLFTIILAILFIFFTIPTFAGYGENYNNRQQQGQAQGQIQGQAQGQAIIGSGNATIHKGAVKVKNTNVNVNKNANINVNANKNVNKNKNTNVNINANKNVNKNKNTNTNTNNSKAVVKNSGNSKSTSAVVGSGNSNQKQGQSQSNTNNSGNQGNSSSKGNTTSVVFNEAETKRDHHTGTTVTFASLGTYAESKYAGSNFQSATILTMFKDVFSYEGAVEVYGQKFGKGLCETVGKSYNGRHLDDPSNEIKVYTMDDKIDPSTIKSIGFLTVKARKGKDATSFTVLQKCVLSACNMQGDAIIVTKEGAETVTKSSGWGIGFNTSGSLINDQGSRGGSYAGSGGTGWSTGSGSLEVLPWITVQVLKYK